VNSDESDLLLATAELLTTFDGPEDIGRRRELARVSDSLSRAVRRHGDPAVVRRLHATIRSLGSAQQAQRIHRHALLRPLAQARFAVAIGSAQANLHLALHPQEDAA
jgi:hypothetical protein